MSQLSYPLDIDSTLIRYYSLYEYPSEMLWFWNIYDHPITKYFGKGDISFYKVGVF